MAGVSGGDHLAHVGGDAGDAEQTGAVIERVVDACADKPCLVCTWVRIPGSSEPLRVAIIRPSSGVKPIVVSTERPSKHRGRGTAVTEMADDQAQVPPVLEQLRARTAQYA